MPLVAALAASVGPTAAADPATPDASALPASANADEPLATSERILELGPTPAQRDAADPVLEFPFTARGDEDLVGARIEIAFERDRLAREAGGFDIAVNDEAVARVPAEAIARADRPFTVEVGRSALAARNLLAIRVDGADRGRCAAPAGAWRAVRSIRVTLRGAPVPLPNDLALLPLPFIDRDLDDRAEIPIVLGGAPTTEHIRAAALVASWLAFDSAIPVTFTARIGELPDTRAVVLVDGPEEAAALEVPAPAGPEVRMTDHPRHAASNVKLLVVGGRDEAELRSAAEALASRSGPLAGEVVALGAAPRAAPAAPYSAPRWVASGRSVRFSEYPGTALLSQEGTATSTLMLRFRVAPDLFVWPSEFITLDLGWSQRLPPGIAAPRLDLEMNGYFLATLPAPPPSPNEVSRRIRLRIPREHMRGFNELLLHVRYPRPNPCAAVGSTEDPPGPPRVAIAPDSTLHFERLPHFTSLPDVSLFAYDGYPFTRVPDLGETAVVVPDRPAPEELSMILSIAAHLASVTGRAATRAVFVPSSRASPGALDGKDVLVIGVADDTPLLGAWSARLPLLVRRGTVSAQMPVQNDRLLEALEGGRRAAELERARSVLVATGHVAAIVGTESPVSPRREAIFVTATSATDIPSFGELLGYAESRARTGDLLLLSRGQRWLFRIGPAFGRGELDRWTAMRWFLANHWLVLVPALAVGVTLLALVTARGVALRVRSRLAAGGAR